MGVLYLISVLFLALLQNVMLSLLLLHRTRCLFLIFLKVNISFLKWSWLQCLEFLTKYTKCHGTFDFLKKLWETVEIVDGKFNFQRDFFKLLWDKNALYFGAVVKTGCFQHSQAVATKWTLWVNIPAESRMGIAWTKQII